MKMTPDRVGIVTSATIRQFITDRLHKTTPSPGIVHESQSTINAINPFRTCLENAAQREYRLGYYDSVSHIPIQIRPSNRDNINLFLRFEARGGHIVVENNDREIVPYQWDTLAQQIRENSSLSRIAEHIFVQGDSQETAYIFLQALASRVLSIRSIEQFLNNNSLPRDLISSTIELLEATNLYVYPPSEIKQFYANYSKGNTDISLGAYAGKGQIHYTADSAPSFMANQRMIHENGHIVGIESDRLKFSHDGAVIDALSIDIDTVPRALRDSITEGMNQFITNYLIGAYTYIPGRAFEYAYKEEQLHALYIHNFMIEKLGAQKANEAFAYWFAGKQREFVTILDQCFGNKGEGVQWLVEEYKTPIPVGHYYNPPITMRN